MNEKIKTDKGFKLSKRGKSIVAIILAAVFLAGILTVFLSFLIPLGFIDMGMNIGQNNYYTRQLIYTDLFKTNSGISDKNIPLDDNGYPLSIPAVDNQGKAVNSVYFLINNHYEGAYSLLYDGDGDFSFSGDNSSERAGGFESLGKNGEGRYDFILHPHPGHRYIIITRSSPDNPAKNFRIIPTKHIGKENQMPLFRKDLTDGLKSMHAIRFMDAGKINSSTQMNWSDRSIPDKFVNDSAGMPYEYMIELCNQLKKDAWICVPHKATDDYHIKLAELICSNLNPKLKIYIEYSNEVWNTAPAFNQSLYVNDNAPDHTDSYVSADLRLISAVGERQRIKSAYMQMRTHRLFKSVFTGKNKERLVTVGAIHTNDWIEETKGMIKYWKDNSALPDVIAGTGYFSFETSHWDYEALADVLPVSSPEELNNYFHNIWNANPQNVTADDIIDAVELLWERKIAPAAKQSADVIIESGAKYVLYEGGQHMQPHNQGEWEYNRAVWDAQISPRMYDLYMKNFKMQKDLGCGLFLHYGYASDRESRYGSWGALEKQSDIYGDLKKTAPKMKAVYDANNRKGFLA